MRLHAGVWFRECRYRSCSTLKDALVHSTWEAITLLIHCPTNPEEKSLEERGSYKEKQIGNSGFIDYGTAYSFFLGHGCTELTGKMWWYPPVSAERDFAFLPQSLISSFPPLWFSRCTFCSQLGFLLQVYVRKRFMSFHSLQCNKIISYHLKDHRDETWINNLPDLSLPRHSSVSCNARKTRGLK